MKGIIKVEFEGNNCLNCPFCYHSSVYNDYICTVWGTPEPYRVIQEYVEYPSELGPRPEWCPIEENK